MNKDLSVQEANTKPIKRFNKKIIFGFIALALLSGIVLSLFFFPRQPPKTYERLRLSNLEPSFRIGSDFTLVNEISIPQTPDNKFYQFNEPNNFSKIRDAALKLGLSNEAFNRNNQRRVFTPQGVNNVSGNFLSIDENTSLVSVIYNPGINSQGITIDTLYAFVRGFFLLKSFETTKVENIVDELNYTIFFTCMQDGKEIRFLGGSNSCLRVYVNEGKITEVYFYYIPEEFEGAGELKPIQSISSSNLSQKDYFLNIIPDAIAGSEFGGERQFSLPLQVNMQKERKAYYFYRNPSQGTYLLPALVINSNYTDQAVQRGNAELIIINQDFN